ncbi:MAG TPA: ABC transporter substrate-binding protein [Gaiellaceae bacterium]|nr:ABC transporter substrate-binding protein [Gaiellaceae bacterium]
MSVKPAKLFLPAILLAALVALGTTAGAIAQDDEKVVLTVGNPGKLDSPNVTVGVTIEAYELWNLHYATLTDKAADDFATIPGLAESWEGSDDGLTWTYTLREGLQWSDGTPLTAEDVAYTVNRSRDEEWINHSATTLNLEASAPDERTVVLVSKVPDPKLPTMDVYIVPKHVYEDISADEITKYPGLDFVGSGPFTLVEVKSGQFWRMAANPNYWGGRPEVDEVVFRTFNNADAMVAALRAGEIDIAQDVPEEGFLALQNEDGIVTVEGLQGGFDELALNAGAGFGKPHPALLDIEFRKAIAHAIDRETIVERVYAGIGQVGTTISPSADPKWIPELTPDEIFEFDLEKSKQMLDAAGYTDSDGNGIREHEGEDISLRYALRTESQVSEPTYEFVSGWLEEIGIDTQTKAYDDSQLTEVIGKGEYDLFTWGWTPFVDPDPLLSYFTCDQVSTDPENPTDYYNDASWCSEEYDRLYKEQNTELDPERRLEIVHEMVKLFYLDAVYFPLQFGGDLQAYRTDRFEGWVKQPAETGPVIFSNTSPSYASLVPIAGGGADGGLSTAAIVALAIAGAAVIGLVVVVVRRRGTREERE